MKNYGLKVLTLLLAFTMLVAVAGCDLFTAGGDKDKEKDSKWEPIKITDTKNHEDPADLEFTERYVLTAEGDSDYIMTMQGIDEFPVRVVLIIYGNDEKALVSYEYNIYETEDGAKAHVDSMVNDGFDIVQDGNIALLYTGTDEMEANLIAFNQWNIMDGETAKDLVDLMSSDFGLVLE